MRPTGAEKNFFIDNLLVSIHVIIKMIRWTGLAQWEFEFPFPGRFVSTFLVNDYYVFEGRGDAALRARAPSPAGLPSVCSKPETNLRKPFDLIVSGHENHHTRRVF